MKRRVNQEFLCKIKKMRCDSQNLYAKINLEALEKAIENLTHNELKLWLYFASKNEKWTEMISPANISAHVNINDVRTVREVKARLKQKGYLRPTEENGNNLIFLDNPEYYDSQNINCMIQ